MVYDDSCAFCTRSMRLLGALDWLRRVDRLGYSLAVDRYPEVGRGALGEGLRMRYPDGSVAVGVDAVRAAGIRTPVGALVSWPLYLPVIHGLGARAYRFIAARRMALGGSCELPGKRMP
jgi:predicted DCC family thiol-disulfide oxidoreductase YuxK